MTASDAPTASHRLRSAGTRAGRSLAGSAPAAAPGLVLTALSVTWAVSDGGYDPQTWSWGALVALSLTTACFIVPRGLAVPTATRAVLGLFAGYVAWCYASIAWASSPGDALQGADQALLYLLIIAAAAATRWTPGTVLLTFTTWALSVGAIAVVLLFRFASGTRVPALVIEGRLAAPTGYFNATAALFTMAALTSVALAARRELPGLARGLLLVSACAGLDLAVVDQSRGWLFTLPIVGLAVLLVARDRLRLIAVGIVPAIGTLAIVHRLLAVYRASGDPALTHAAEHAGRPALMILVGVLVVGTVIAWGDRLRGERRPSRVWRVLAEVSLCVVLIVGAVAGGDAATHGHPLSFISRQWNGFSRPETFSAQSHFVDVGSSRYDFWRVSLDAFASHPVLGLGEDNFADYYLVHRHTTEEPSSTHSFELRLLAQTGLVGTLLMAGFVVVAMMMALRMRRRPGLEGALAAIGTLPFLVWLIHGSIDWFWEMPALTGPALGFLIIAGHVSKPSTTGASRRRATGRVSVLRRVLGGIGLAAACTVLGTFFLSQRELSLAASAPTAAAALSNYSTAASLDPLSSVPGRLAGVTALLAGYNAEAQREFSRSIAHEPGAWFSWLGEGLAASALGHRSTAEHAFRHAYLINHSQPVDGIALARVNGPHPLTGTEAMDLLVVR